MENFCEVYLNMKGLNQLSLGQVKAILLICSASLTQKVPGQNASQTICWPVLNLSRDNKGTRSSESFLPMDPGQNGKSRVSSLLEGDPGQWMEDHRQSCHKARGLRMVGYSAQAQ